MLTVREMADRISPAEAGLLFERIRHWTREGLLTPVGEKHPGTGRSRLYDERALQKARVLNDLTGFGLTIHKLLVISYFLDNGDSWLAASYLIIRVRGERLIMELAEDTNWTILEKTGGVIIVDLRPRMTIEAAQIEAV